MTGAQVSVLRRAVANPWLATLLVVAGLLVLVALVAAGVRLARPGVLPGTVVADPDVVAQASDDADEHVLEVGGLDRDELEATLAAYGDQRGSEPIRVAADDDEVTTTAAEAGYAFDVEATADAVWRRGRQLNPIAAAADHVRAFRQSTIIPPSDGVGATTVEEWASEVAATLDEEPVHGEVAFDGARVEVTEPEAGREVDREALAEDGARVAALPGAQEVAAEYAVLEPEHEPEEIADLAADAERAVSAPVHLVRGDAALEFSPEQIGDLLAAGLDADVEPPEDSPFGIDPDDVDALVDEEQRAAVATDPVDAQIFIAGGTPEIEPSEDGFAFDPERTAEQLASVAVNEESSDGAPREAELDGETVEPDRTTADAEDLQITEQVSSFTTNHAAGQSRVVNIQRMADIVSGVLVEPGEEFSINDHVGPRTRAKGFVEGGIILRGEFVDAVGGGVSQFATTFFNAAWFGGYEILEHRPHSYYISRYPMGHEATLDYGSLDVRIRNDSPHGLLITTSYTASSITVSFWGTDWVDVTSSTSGATNVRAPETEYEENPSLDPGEERVIQSGRNGFDVTYRRVLDYHNGGTDEEVYTHRYVPEPRIVERNTEEPDDDEDDEDEDDDGDDGD